MAHGRRQIWVERVAQFQKSGLTARAFSAQFGVNQGTLLKWKYRFAREQSSRADEATSSPRVEFVELTAAVPGAAVIDDRLEVVLAGGRSVRVPRGFDAECLRQVVDILEAR